MTSSKNVTSHTVQKNLSRLHNAAGLSWRQIAQLPEYSPVPFGTLNSIYHTGQVPFKWLAHFGIQEMRLAPACVHCGNVHVTKRCPTKQHQHKDLFSLPPEILRWQLENRYEYEPTPE